MSRPEVDPVPDILTRHALIDDVLGGDPIDHRIAETMRRTWTGFAHYGVNGLESSALRFG
jgi:hypothetical protein